MEAEATPFPSPEQTPPVTKMYLLMGTGLYQERPSVSTEEDAGRTAAVLYCEHMQEASSARDLRRFLPLLLTLGIGVLVSVAVFFVFLRQERERLRTDFQVMAADRAQAIRTALNEDQIELGLVADYVSASTELSRGELSSFVQEFARLARRITTHEEDMQVIAFVSAVPPDGRASFEAVMRKSVDAGFTIREASGKGPLRPATVRDRYFPISVMEPEQYSGSVLGLDVATVPALRSALEHAIESGKATASVAVDLPLSESGPVVVWNFRSIHRSARVSDPTANRTGLMGVCVAAFRVDQMVELALNALSPAGIDLELRDESAPAAQRVLYYHRSRAAGVTASSVLKAGMKWGTTIDAGEHTWTLTAYPTTSFIARHRSWQSSTILIGGLLLTGLSGFVFWGRLRRTEQVEAQVTVRTQELAEEISKHEDLERALAESRSALTAQVSQLNEQNQQIQLLTDVGDALQSCLAVDEAYATVSLQAPRLLPGTSGTLFVHDPLKGLFLSAAEWGPHRSVNPAFKAEDCWALRRGKPHAVTPAGTNLPCPHAAGLPDTRSLCLPLSASGRTIGLLQVTESVAEHVGLALSNIMLRSDLRQMSIHDPLTGLFNRRYMEESLETEIHRADRRKGPIGVIMLDIDHFKAFNDGFGHAAGDQMLRAIGSLVHSRLRAGDIACRFGGEELVLILPEANLEAAIHRAEDLRASAKKLEVKHEDTPLGQVTVSLGVAVYPVHGLSRNDLLSAADSALYKAKDGGRDRVEVAQPGAEKEAAPSAQWHGGHLAR
jgi:diguanylate cyclase (GGDEF)-like protein